MAGTPGLLPGLSPGWCLMARDTRRQALDAALADHPAGTIERDGRVVGGWYSLGREAKDSVMHTVQAIGRVDGDGLRVAVFECVAPDAADAAAALAAPTEGSVACRSAQARYGLSDVASSLCVIAAMGDPKHGKGRGSRWLWPERHLDAVSESLRRRYPAMAHQARRDAAVDALLDIHRALSPFLDTLDGKALAMAVRHGLFEALGDRWRMVDETCGGSPALRDAIDAAPHLAAQLLHAHARDPGRVEAVLALDGPSGAVADWLRRDFGMAPSLAWRHEAAALAVAPTGRDFRKAVPQSLRNLAADPASRHVAVMRLASLLPSNWLPHGGWDGFVEAVPVVTRALALAGKEGLAGFLAAGPDWDAWLARLRDVASRPALAHAVDDLADPVRALVAQVIRPSLAASGLDDGDRDLHGHMAWHALYHGRTLRRCLEVSARWHAADPGIRTSLAALPRAGQAARPARGPARDWEPGLRDGRVGDVSLVVLLTAADLAAEGTRGPDGAGMDGLDHCVGNYADDCLSGHARIVSVRGRDASGRTVRLSTVELRPGAGRPEVSQHAGRRNSSAPAKAERALRTWLDGDCGYEPGTWAPVPGHRALGGASYDAAVEGNLRGVEALWAPFLPKPMRRIGPDGWAAVAMSVLSDPGVRPWSPRPPAGPGPAASPGMAP